MNIKIKENNEPLVDIKKFCPDVIIAIDKRRIKIEKTAYLRLGVAKMLRRAKKSLPKGINFIVADAWRPVYVQIAIYFWFVNKFQERYPHWPRKRVIREIEKYVAPWKGNNASGHMSGGAIDIRLVNSRGRKISMKSKKLSYQENALSIQKKLPGHIRRNREILFQAMRKAGFSNYPKEYWHWSYGDYHWAKRNHKLFAIYDAVQDIRSLYFNKFCPCGARKKYKKCHGK